MIEKYINMGSACDPSVFLQFDNPKAKIDFITLPLTQVFDATGDLRLLEAMGGGSCHDKMLEGSGSNESDRDKRNPYNSPKVDWITIHDPKPEIFAFLVDRCPSVEVSELEIALDYFLKDGTNDRQRLERLHKHIVHSLALGKGLKRKYYDPVQGRYVRDSLRTKHCGTTVIWEDWHGGVKVKCYVKTEDNKTPLDNHCVRLEVTLRGNGPLSLVFNRAGYMAWQKTELKNPTAVQIRAQQQARRQFVELSGFCPDGGSFAPAAKGRFRVAMLPELAKKLRTELTGFLSIAEGIKPTLKRTRAAGKRASLVEKANQAEEAKVLRAWQKYGSAWALKHGHLVRPNTSANEGIGKALFVLQRQIGIEIAKLFAQKADLGGVGTG